MASFLALMIIILQKKFSHSFKKIYISLKNHVIEKIMFFCQAVPLLIPVLTQSLTQHDNDPDDPDFEQWNVGTAAGACLGLVALTVGNACLDAVLAFVSENFGNQVQDLEAF